MQSARFTKQGWRQTMKWVFTIAAAVIALGGLDPRPSMAGGVRPWCEYGAMFGSIGDCSYATLEQCLRTARGDGRCERNPRFDWRYFMNGQPAPADVAPDGRPMRRRHP
jgi:Protein of unknown function (DUF3551)